MLIPCRADKKWKTCICPSGPSQRPPAPWPRPQRPDILPPLLERVCHLGNQGVSEKGRGVWVCQQLIICNKTTNSVLHNFFILPADLVEYFHVLVLEHVELLVQELELCHQGLGHQCLVLDTGGPNCHYCWLLSSRACALSHPVEEPYFPSKHNPHLSVLHCTVLARIFIIIFFYSMTFYKIPNASCSM